MVVAALPSRRAELLVVDPEAVASGYTAVLRNNYSLSITDDADLARDYLWRVSPALLIFDPAAGGCGAELYKTAHALPRRPSILVTTRQVEEVPDALAAGCDGVLLKPFAPILLVTRVARMLREQSEQLRQRTTLTRDKAVHLVERGDLLRSGTNRVWPGTHCPYCAHVGVTSFDYASLRRAWYACSACRKVWIARRKD